MKTVYRIDLADAFDLYGAPSDRATIRLPKDARVIHVAVQQRAPHHPCMWVELTTDTTYFRDLEFAIVGTGREVPDDWTHVGTWQEQGYVWHLYEGPREKGSDA